jgi:hypothetical protein
MESKITPPAPQGTSGTGENGVLICPNSNADFVFLEAQSRGSVSKKAVREKMPTAINSWQLRNTTAKCCRQLKSATALEEMEMNVMVLLLRQF